MQKEVFLKLEMLINNLVKEVEILNSYMLESAKTRKDKEKNEIKKYIKIFNSMIAEINNYKNNPTKSNYKKFKIIATSRLLNLHRMGSFLDICWVFKGEEYKKIEDICIQNIGGAGARILSYVNEFQDESVFFV